MTQPLDKVRSLQEKLYVAAKASPTRRFGSAGRRRRAWVGIGTTPTSTCTRNSAWTALRARGLFDIQADSGCVNAVGEPCEGDPQARFDEGRGETRVMPGAPRLLYRCRPPRRRRRGDSGRSHSRRWCSGRGGACRTAGGRPGGRRGWSLLGFYGSRWHVLICGRL